MLSKEQYIHTFLDLYKKYGFKSISVNDLALHTGVSKKTIYKYFYSRDEIIRSVVRQLVSDLNKTLHESVDERADAISNIINLVTSMVKNLSKINPVFFYTLQKLNLNVEDLFDELRNEYKKNLQRFINNGIEEGVFRENMDKEYLLLSHENIISLLITNPTENFNHATYDTKRFVYGLIDNIRGFTTVKGHKLIDKRLELVEKIFQKEGIPSSFDN